MFKSVKNIADVTKTGLSIDRSFEIVTIQGNDLIGELSGSELLGSNPSIEFANSIPLSAVASGGQVIILDASFSWKANSIDLTSNRFRIRQTNSCGTENPTAGTELVSRPFLYNVSEQDGNYNNIILNRFKLPMVKNSSVCPRILMDLRDGTGTGIGIGYNISVTIAYQPAV